MPLDGDLHDQWVQSELLGDATHLCLVRVVQPEPDEVGTLVQHRTRPCQHVVCAGGLQPGAVAVGGAVDDHRPFVDPRAAASVA
jgi:hypothetical protein